MKRSPLFNNMQVKLMLLFFVVALAPLCAVGILSIRTAEELILSMAANQIEHVAADKAALLERWISERKADIEVLAGSSVLRSMDPEQIAPYLQLVRNKYKAYDDISVASRDGALVCRSSEHAPAFEAQERFTPTTIDRLSMSDIVMSPDRKDSFFRISAPLLGKTGDLEGFVSASVGTGAVLSAVLKVSLGETGECYLVNRDGAFLAHKEPERILSENIAQSESFKNIFNAQKPRITYIDYRGVEVIGASRMVGGTRWALVVEQDKNEAFRSVGELRRYIVLVICLSIFGAFISSWLLSRYVAEPIRKLSKAAHSLARGEFETLHLKAMERGDEIGRLYDAFAEMAGQLQNRQQRLEEKVTRKEAALKETDVRLRQTQEAAARSHQLAALGHLAAGVAHEIRTPLTSLKMFLQSIESDMEISPECEEDFDVAMNQVKRMEATINRFLDFARPQDPVFTQVDVRELIENALLVVGPRAKQQETVVRTDIDRLLPRLRGDRKQLEEALLNLMINGLEAVAFGGELKISACAEISPANGELREFIHIVVEDTGPGIDKAALPSLFDPFFTTKPTGTGLGLSIVYATLRSHEGRVDVESSSGNGAAFSLRLPVRSEGAFEQDGKNTDR